MERLEKEKEREEKEKLERELLENNFHCNICLEQIETIANATIDCNHKFCFDCKEWSNEANTCPTYNYVEGLVNSANVPYRAQRGYRQLYIQSLLQDLVQEEELPSIPIVYDYHLEPLQFFYWFKKGLKKFKMFQNKKIQMVKFYFFFNIHTLLKSHIKQWGFCLFLLVNVLNWSFKLL
ncbi:hypothetical protein DICPUDRAFT_82132 [Dictyostelium purpureum]|uniref:RING-type domain-containing protein n=1 Tax=Dictyostelium purpureum TaxID=5786 RepID=F0ZVL8_DICPU|nr:uncharacterized protein DICPUDRAFT_82132 [Dictyostelium purpureum]EGC32004.1 hypothetical protein DICPUDRAFT_82132 [Dictyostelium purpureum]|eukprot:XP_003291460.1 hypothetical protein DICPUDRAFT_82132 [Dictyostelium purpureum]